MQLRLRTADEEASWGAKPWQWEFLNKELEAQKLVAFHRSGTAEREMAEVAPCPVMTRFGLKS